MKLRRTSTNAVEITSHDGVKLLFSYADAVAGYHPKLGWLKTTSELSKASAWHVREWLDEQDADNVQLVPQGTLDALMVADTVTAS